MTRAIIPLAAALALAACGTEQDEPAPPASAAPAAPAQAPSGPPAGGEPAGAAAGAPEPSDQAPFVIGGGGKRVPDGFQTTFTVAEGRVEIPYTQVTAVALDGETSSIVSFKAQPPRGAKPAAPAAGQPMSGMLELWFRSGDARIAKPEELAGKAFDLEPNRGGQIALGDGRFGTLRAGRIQFEAAAAGALEGTFRAEVQLAGPQGRATVEITDGAFRAYPAQFVVGAPPK